MKIKKKLFLLEDFFLYEYHSDLVFDCKLNLIKNSYLWYIRLESQKYL